MNSKHCPYCNFSTKVVKIGRTSSGRRRYKCKRCKRTWTNKPHPQVLAKAIWNDLIFHNLNYEELADKYGVSSRTIRRKLNNYRVPEILPIVNRPEAVKVIAIDVTYFGRSWGVLTVIDVYTGKALYCTKTKGYETVSDYEKAVQKLHQYGIEPQACVVDGKKGVIEILEGYGIKVQFCQFHQLKIINNCLTRKPKLDQNKELRTLSLELTHTDRKHFENWVYNWRLKHLTWLKERTVFEDGRWEYTHKLTRRAIHSLIHNLPYLFTFKDYPELNIPNTNNKIEGIHSELKRRLANHRGMKMKQKIQFIRIFLSGRTGV